jgi:hypothetical protein
VTPPRRWEFDLDDRRHWWPIRRASRPPVPTRSRSTGGDVTLTADILILWRVIDPFKTVLSLGNVEEALKDVAGTALEDLDADVAIAYAGRAANVMEERLKDVGKRWESRSPRSGSAACLAHDARVSRRSRNRAAPSGIGRCVQGPGGRTLEDPSGS